MNGKSDVDQRSELSGDAAIQKARALLPKFRSTMMATAAANGDLHVRPLALQGDLTTFGGVLWFFTDERSWKVQESAGGGPVSIICQSDEDSAYLHLTGTASITRDLSKMRELYSPLLKTWFPEGLDDPHLVLIKFEADSGVYWERPSGLLRAAAAFATSVVTGSPGKSGEAGNLHF